MLVALTVCVSCDRHETAAPSTKPYVLSVACLVPSVTDIIVEMGAADHLVAVSTFDRDRDATRGLPSVGDYQSTDWEQVRALHPAIMIRQFAPDRVPPALKEKTQELRIELVNLKIDTLADIFAAIDTVGQILGESQKAATLKARLIGQIEGVRRQTAGRARPTVLAFFDATGESVVGPGTYFDELLSDAGGANAAAELKQLYPTIDREMLHKLDPDVIVQLLPSATPQLLERAKQTWAGQPELKAVRNGRVYTMTDRYVLLLGAHVGDVAEQLARLLHPDATTQPSE
jgi:ABC-type Fe3+-hydroxamate transport system substrate-binding protein